MIIVWLGVALFSVSWLFGLGYYHPVDWVWWSLLVALGYGCFLGFPSIEPPPRRSALAAFMLSVPALLVAPWPHKAGVSLLVAGLLIHLSFLRRSTAARILDLARRVSTAGIVAGLLLLVQSLAITWYTGQTAHCHELPAPLPQILGGLATLLGADVGVHDNTIALHSMRQIHYLGATWELLFDPTSFCFLAAAVALTAWTVWSCAAEQRKGFLTRAILAVGIVLVIWLPLRAGLLLALHLHAVLRTDFEAPLGAMRMFWNSWLHLLLLVGPVLLFWRFAPPALVTHHDRQETATSSHPSARTRQLAIPISAALGIALIAFGVFWDPVGTRQQGRVIVDEYHPEPDKIWERTDRPYDTSWYGDLAGYNYYCIYDYCSRFYAMSRSTQPLETRQLSQCDVLIIKVPTRPFSQAEVRNIRGFVQQGGGLLLIGEHTNVFKTSDHLNPVADTFGFQFRSDCLFGIDAVFQQRYEPPFVPHPIVQRLTSLDFATSCSIDPVSSHGRGVIVDTGLKNLMADYHASNYYPQPNNQAEMRYGAFVQLWATRYGRGRVVAFTDSTIFSNFSVFEPGKAELMLGMIEWLNHRSWLADPRPLLVSSGALILLAGLVLARRWTADPLLLVTAGLLGWSIAVVGVRAIHRVTMPKPSAPRSFVQVVIDRTACDCPLAKNGFVDGTQEGFGIFERWILRLGYFTARRKGAHVFDSDLVIFVRPHRPASRKFCRQLVDYVESGGKVLVVDSVRDDSTTNQLLEPFALAMDHQTSLDGLLETAAAWPTVQVTDAAVVAGGEAFASIEGQPVGTIARHGNGLVAVIGFGSRFHDANMGVTSNVVPDDALMQVFQLQFALLRSIVEPP